MAKSDPGTTDGRKMMKGHLMADKKILKERIKLEKKDLKNNQAHARDHATGAKSNRQSIAKYTQELKTKGKGSTGSTGTTGGKSGKT